MAAKAEFLISATNQTGKAFAEIDKSLGGLKSGFASLTAAIGGIAFGSLAKSAVDFADRLNDVSGSIGISTDTLQEFEHVARMSGVGTEKMDDALKGFTTRLGQMQAGTGKLNSFLEHFDGNLQSSLKSAKSSDEALTILVGAMGKLGSQTERNALAQAAFGEAGADMVNIIRDGGDAFDTMRKQAHEFGQVIDQDVIQNAAAMNDTLDTMGAALRVQLLNGLNLVLPSLNELGRGFVEYVIPGIAAAIDGATRFGRALGALAAALNFVGLGEFKNAADALSGAWDELAKKTDRVASITPKVAQGFKAVAATKTELGGLVETNKKITKELDDQAKKLADLAADKARLSRREAEEAEANKMKILEFKASLYDADLEALEKTDELSDAAKDLGLTFSSAFEDAIVGGEKFSDVLKGLADDIARMIIRKSITEPIANGISGMFTAGMGGASGGAGSGFGDFFGSLFGNARGGIYKVAGSAMEHPIAFNAKAGETVAVNPAGAASGGGPVNVSINLTSLDPSNAATVVAGALPQLRGLLGGIVNGEFKKRGRRAY